MKYKLKDIFDLQMGKTPSRNNTEYWNTEEHKWISIADLTKTGKYISETKECLSNRAIDDSGIKVIPANTVVMSFKLSIGKTAITAEDMYSNEAIMAFHDKHVIDILPEYIFYMFKHKNWDEGSNKAVMGKTLNKATLSEVEIEICSVEEQREIVGILDKMTSVLEGRENELDLLDTLIKARFVEMFGSIHDGKFEMKTLPEIVRNDKNSIKRGPFGGALKKDDFVDEGYLVYEQRHAIHNDFDYAKYYITQEKYEDMIGFKVVPGDLIISCSGVTLGRIAEVPNGAKAGIINQALLKLSLNQELMMNTFFIQQFRGEEIQEILFGFSRGSGIPNMPSMSEVKVVKFVCPPLEMQKQYCDFVHQVNKSKVVYQIIINKLTFLQKICYNNYKEQYHIPG